MKIIKFPGSTKNDLPVKDVINGAIKNELSGIVILGYDKDDFEYFASSFADRTEVLWLLERCKAFIMDDYEGE